MSGSVAGPIACRLPPHLTVCRRHRLWIGPAGRAHAGQLDVSPFPEILRVQRRHLTHLRHHPWQDVEATISAATRAIVPQPQEPAASRMGGAGGGCRGALRIPVTWTSRGTADS
jgi:hypothetical protein